ncbi:MAG: hypothetical protein MHM6MM_009659, partial [Cercozoa sp. M6MM]
VAIVICCFPVPRTALVDARHHIRAATRNILYALNSVTLAFCAVDVTTSRIHTLRADTCLAQAHEQLMAALGMLKMAHMARRFYISVNEIKRCENLIVLLRQLRLHLEVAAYAEQGTMTGVHERHVAFLVRLRSPLRDVVNALAPVLEARTHK